MNRAPTWLRLVSAQADNRTSKDPDFNPGTRVDAYAGGLMNIPINPEHAPERRRRYGADGNFMTMPAPRPEQADPENPPAHQPADVSRVNSTAITPDPARELVKS